MNIQKAKLCEIFPYYNNPRDNSKAVEPVINSLKMFGFIKPIMVDKNNIIICGHTRYIAAYQCGCEYVPIIVSDMPEEQAKRYRILDNKIAEKSSFNEDELIEELRKMKAPEEMQAFFFEDINTLLNFSMDSLQHNINDAGGFASMEEYDDGFGDYSENTDSVEPEEHYIQEEKKEDPAENLFRASEKEDGTYMKVVCPFCGNVEEIKIN